MLPTPRNYSEPVFSQLLYAEAAKHFELYYLGNEEGEMIIISILVKTENGENFNMLIIISRFIVITNLSTLKNFLVNCCVLTDPLEITESLLSTVHNHVATVLATSLQFISSLQQFLNTSQQFITTLQIFLTTPQLFITMSQKWYSKVINKCLNRLPTSMGHS